MKAKRWFLREKEAKRVLSEFFESIKVDPNQFPELKPPVELAQANDYHVYFISGKPVLVKTERRLFPTLTFSKLLSTIPKVTVNMGAVPYVCDGADVMAPGIVGFEGIFGKGDIVVVHDERHQKPIALAEALLEIEEARRAKRGKVLHTFHYVGDKLWTTIQQLAPAG
jgi:PUA domain protein